MPEERDFSKLERNILKAKGLSDEQIGMLVEAGIASRADLETVGDATTLAELAAGLEPDVAARVIEWATGNSTKSAPNGPTASPAPGPNIVFDTADVVHCIHCGAKQPKDYKTGDLCIACGKQAEPILTCYWCSASGPGKFCRSCGAEFVPTGELDLAVLLKREGLPKEQIPTKLLSMSAAEKDVLWGRVRKLRG